MQIEAAVWNEWYPVAVVEDLKDGFQHRTSVLGYEIDYGRDAEGTFIAHLADGSGKPCRTQTRYHTHWVSLGTPDDSFFELPEFDEADRRILGSGSMKVHVSGLRVIENFLDMAHFPYVHTGLLGEEPHTDVAPYRVEHDVKHDEIYANGCKFYQPMAAATATNGIEAEYVYRVTRPFVSILYKTSPPQPTRRDAICLFVQPLDEEWCIAHVVLVYIDETTSDRDLRLFQQNIFGQDLMILTNHVPRTLPLDPKFEVPTRADAMSAAYRRWLHDKGVVYGTYRAA
ncbi:MULTISPECIES: aromatic ring-hydroxylating oxygenase subunit alpha [Pseudomonas]|jgi:phenylpropionate dioxygenase-like ring-hydroxylating dioxygenase large terminal subunit|uniref:Putative methylxanthine N7-demethylase NdmC n=1 Tax=Pseudomonas fluorescens TaxID=294 RepID=A0A5E6VI84_PSEFL|nr:MULTISPECIES: aromatic ring-hydroxylating dioxygenase subunit alpha [Pseudomonas]VVN17697.1 putative methylxanthine N7-demethylase NdmC [Pseudomonas fluorescens]